MSDTQRLLRYDPETAVLIMVNEAYGLHLRREIAYVSDREPLADGKIRVTVTGRPSIDEGIPSSYEGSVSIVVQRLSLNEIFGEFTVQAAPPATVRSVVELLSRSTKIKFDDMDFTNEIITTHEFMLKADPESLRWYGQTKITLDELSDYIIDPIDPNPIDPGPDDPYIELTVTDMAPEQELDGFSPPT